MNYGHPLEFGTLIAPPSGSPDAAVSLAVCGEELGLDLVSCHDRPYDPEFLDAWTLLSWVAARTERVRLAANVLNLPLRDPAVMARSAASLDLLSAGRLEMALGAGARRDAIDAMGGRGLDPGRVVEAVEEAVDVLRGLWDMHETAPLRMDGNHYRPDGAQRGPVAAHDIPVWLGGAGPRMLRLIGRKADGWLAPPEAVEDGRLATANAIIDESAREAGRDPREIRRLADIRGRFAPERGGFLEGPSEKWVDDLLPLAVRDGVGTFVLVSDDPAAMERFAYEVAPALRAAVDRELPGAFAGPRVRRSAVRALRRPGIDYDGIPASLADTAIEPGDPPYASVRSTYLRGGSPGLILRPGSTAEVADALAFARGHHHLPLGVRSGGHGLSGRSTNDGGPVIDVSRLDRIEVLDEETRRVRIGPGARWKHVAAALDPYGWALGSGDYGGVGVGGLATAGGIGFLSREQGLTIDRLRAAEIVLADGSVLRASEEDRPDLFWAIRGAGANFGIVTSFEFEADEVRKVGWAQLILDASDTADLLEKWGKAAANAPRDTTSFLVVSPPRRGQPAIAQVMVMVHADDPDTVVDRVRPFAQISSMYDQQVMIAPYTSVMAMAPDGDHQGRGEPLSRSGFVREVSPAFAAAVPELLRRGGVYFFQMRTVGGAVSDVDPDATAYPHRSAGFHVTAMGINRQRLDTVWDEMSSHFEGLYLSFETDPRPERLDDAFPPRTLRRLRDLKSRYDPDNLFRDNFNIAPGD